MGFLWVVGGEVLEIDGEWRAGFEVLREEERTRVMGGGVADLEALSEGVGESGGTDAGRGLLAPRAAEWSERRLRGAGAADDCVMERCKESEVGENW